MTFSDTTQDIVSLDEEPVNVDIRIGKEQSKAEEAMIEEVDTAALPESHGVRNFGEEAITEAAITEQDIPMIVVTDATTDGSRQQRSSRLHSSTSMDYLKVQSPNFQVAV